MSDNTATPTDQLPLAFTPFDELKADIDELHAVAAAHSEALQDQRSELAERAGRLEEALGELQANFGQLLDALEAKKQDEKPLYPTLHEWVEQHFVQLLELEQPHRQYRWCPQWWDHPTAVSLLEALWSAWEDSRRQGRTSGVWWWRECYVPLSGILFSETGPFAACRQGAGGRAEHRVHAPLPSAETPEDRTVVWEHPTIAERPTVQRPTEEVAVDV